MLMIMRSLSPQLLPNKRHHLIWCTAFPTIVATGLGLFVKCALQQSQASLKCFCRCWRQLASRPNAFFRASAAVHFSNDFWRQSRYISGKVLRLNTVRNCEAFFSGSRAATCGLIISQNEA